MMLILVLLYCFCLEKVYSQTDIPYVSFMGDHLANHSYLHLSQVGMATNGQDSVKCHTDLSSCCSDTEGDHRGDWYFPNGNRLLFDEHLSVYESRGDMRVDLRRNSDGDSAVSGIYHCDIQTNAVHQSSARERVYIGLYTSGGGIYLIMRPFVLSQP